MLRRSERIRNKREALEANMQGKEKEQENNGPSGSRGAGNTADTCTFQRLQSELPQEPQRTKTDGQQKSPVKRTRRERRRSLSHLPDMPLDILYEIFGLLAPLDLLHLARTTKAVRDVLMRRSAIVIWKKALASIEGLPECPDDLNEPQYTRLVFDHHCHFCGAVAKLAYWTSRVRCCKRCFPAQFLAFGDHLRLDNLYKHIPYEVRPNTSSVFILKERADTFLTQAVSLQGDKREFMALCETRKAAMIEIQRSAKALTIWQCLQESERARELEEIRARRRTMVIEKLQPYNLHDELYLMEEKMRNCTLEQKWFRDPTELTDRIWDNIKDSVILYMRRAQALRLTTERALQQGPFLEFISLIYDEFIRAEKNSHPLRPIPGLADICVMPEVLGFFERLDRTDGVPLSLRDLVQLKEERYKILNALPGMCDDWRAACRRTLFSVMPPQEPDPSHVASTSTAEALSDTTDNHAVNEVSPDTRLDLATTWFNCSGLGSTSSAIGYPRILAFPKLMQSAKLDLDLTTATALLQNALIMKHDFSPWNRGNYRVGWDAQSVATAKILVEACGKDLETTTAKEMDDLDPWFACAACAVMSRCFWFSGYIGNGDDDECVEDFPYNEAQSGQGSERGKQRLDPRSGRQYLTTPAFPWRRAVCHHEDCKQKHGKWVLLNAQDKARILESSVPENESGDIWQCTRCRSCSADPEDSVMRLIAIKSHITLDHGIPYESSQEGIDYFKALHMKHSDQDTPYSVNIFAPHTWIPVD